MRYPIYINGRSLNTYVSEKTISMNDIPKILSPEISQIPESNNDNSIYGTGDGLDSIRDKIRMIRQKKQRNKYITF